MNYISYYITKKFLLKAAEKHIAQYPRIACYSFDLITNFILLDGQYERDQLNLLETAVFPRISQDSSCIDVGANIGNHSLHFAKYFKNVVCLEPHPSNFTLLEINTKSSANIKALNIGASDKECELIAIQDRINLAGSSLNRKDRQNGSLIQFALKKMDCIEEILNLKKIGFIKFDIEGHEPAAIQGAKSIIMRHKPLIMLEVLAEEVQNNGSKSLSLLRELGYTFIYEPVENGILGNLPKRIKNPLRTIQEITTGKHVSKAGRLKRIFSLQKKNYLMLICSTVNLLDI